MLFRSGNTQRFDELDNAIQALKDAGLSDEDVQSIVDKSTEGLSTELKGAIDEAVKGNSEAIGDLQENVDTQFSDLKGVIDEKLGDQADVFDAKVQDLIDQGATYQDATNKALDDLGTSVEDLGKDVADKMSGLEDTLGTQISGVEDKLTTAIDDAKAQGLAGDEALQEAIDSVSSDLGTTKQDLLDQLGLTETALREDFATQLGDVSADVQDRFDALSEDQQALAQQLEDQGVNLSDAIDAAESELTSQFTTQLGDVQDQLSSAIEDAKAQGLAGDEIGRAHV